ncbi:MAG: tetratricopeptide repeat protein [Acidobacteria bacterium]|nr:tetratricopeptide repeat protein [Acidobacteriota bacterium]
MTTSDPLRRPAWHRAVLAVLAMGLLLAFPLAAQQPKKPPADSRKAASDARAQAALAGAQEALERKDYDTAIAVLENFLFDHPGHVEALFNLAYAYSLAGRTADAMDMYRQTLEVDPKLVPARINLGLLLLNKNQPEEAAAEFRQVLEIEPEHYRAQLYAATALERNGKKDEAIAHYERAAKLKPEEAEPRQALLALLLEKQDLEGAGRVLDELLALSPDNAELWLNRAELRRVSRQKPEALAAYEKYFQLASRENAASPSTRGEMHMRAGWLARELEQPEKALEHFQAARREGGDAFRLASLEGQAEVLISQERYAEAIPLCEEVATLKPEDAGVRETLGYAYLEMKNYVKAVEHLNVALRLDPRREPTYNYLASALYLGGNLAGAIAVLDRRAALAAETPATLFLRAISYDKLNQCQPAITYYEKFLEQNRDTRSDEYFQATARLRLLQKSCRDKRR